MNRNLFFTVFAIMASLAFLAVSDRADSLDITQIIQGTVKEAKGNFINITEDSGKEAQVATDTNTVYDGVQKLTDLKVGDKVQIEYHEGHDKNIATMITKIESDSEDGL